MDNNRNGFTIVEILVSLGIMGVVFLTIISFVLWANYYNAKIKSDREAGENARRIMDIMVNEIRESISVYAPTASVNQLSLETKKYVPEGETRSYIDFFLCGTALCMKKESQNPISLTTGGVEISSLAFLQISSSIAPSVQIDLTVSYKNPNTASGNYASLNLKSTAVLRSY